MTQKHIARVTLHNYRSHEHTDIEIGMLTSLIGENDCGKSNVYNAIDMVLTNSPFTEGALRYGTKEGWVRVTFHDGTWIERHRSGSKQKAVLFDNKRTQEYSTIKDLGGIVEEFTGFKAVVLDKQTKAESVQLVPIDAGQNFMIIGSSAEVVNRRIQRLMHGAGIETAKIQLEKEYRVLSKQAEVDQKAFDKSQELVKLLEEDTWDHIAQGVDDANKALADLANIDNDFVKIDAVFDAIPRWEWLCKAKATVPELDALFLKLEVLMNKQNDLDHMIEPLKVRDQIFESLETIRTTTLTISQIEDEMSGLNQEITRLEEEEKQRAIQEAVAAQTVAAAQPVTAVAQTETVDGEVSVPVALVLDTIDCLHSFVDRRNEGKNIALAQEIAEDWSKLCPAS
jgi:predicted ATP-dependent endonuclease of OLD family